MMKYYIWSLFILGMLLVNISCTHKREENIVGYSFDVQKPLSFEQIPYPGLLGMTMQLVKRDSFLLINDFHGDSLIHVFNLKSMRIEQDLVAKGNGPHELISPLDLQLLGDTLWVLCRPLHLLNHILWKDIRLNSTLLVKDRQMKGESDCFVSMGKNQFILSGFWNKRYALINMIDGDSIREFGDYPNFWSKEEYIPVTARAIFHHCRFAVNTSQHLIVSCSPFVLEIYQYDPEGRQLPKLKFRKQLGRYEYDFVADGRVSAFLRKESDPGAVDVFGGNNYLYVLMKAGKQKKQRNIMVLDWKGNPVKLLIGKKHITCFTIDETAKRGYCIIRDQEDKLVSFRL